MIIKVYYLYMRNKNLRKSIQNICIEAIDIYSYGHLF